MSPERIRCFQELMRTKNIDASMIRTLSSFTYFAGVKWLRPAILIPADGDATAFIFKHEVRQFTERSHVKEVTPYGGVDELIRGITSTIREKGYKRVGFDVSVERDAYELFFNMFKNLNPQIEIVDVHSLIMELRMSKDPTEIQHIRRASEITDQGMKAAANAIDVGASELDIAAEATYAMMKKGSEHPHVYVNTGEYPRKHAEPRRDIRVTREDAVMITVAGDYQNYYSNETRTHMMEGAPSKKRRALETLEHAYSMVEEKLRVGVELNTIEYEIGQILRREGYADSYVQGFAHGVGLLVEEDPITTIVIPHRRQVVKENMVLAAIHTPLAIPGVGAIKCEDTFLVKSDGPERLTKFACESK
ncbi:M24 family metallopeptidase [[Eubacterium] cellulosolvens]